MGGGVIGPGPNGKGLNFYVFLTLPQIFSTYTINTINKAAEQLIIVQSAIHIRKGCQEKPFSTLFL